MYYDLWHRLYYFNTAVSSLKHLGLGVERVTHRYRRAILCLFFWSHDASIHSGREDFQELYWTCVRRFTPMGTGPSWGRWVEIDRCYQAPSWSGLGGGVDLTILWLTCCSLCLTPEQSTLLALATIFLHHRRWWLDWSYCPGFNAPFVKVFVLLTPFTSLYVRCQLRCSLSSLRLSI